MVKGGVAEDQDDEVKRRAAVFVSEMLTPDWWWQ
jgi:hypothetical protein